jgi:sialidase-1
MSATGRVMRTGGLKFDGVDDQVDCGYGLTGLGRGEFTLMAWANCLGAGTGPYPSVLWREYLGNILISRNASTNKWYFFIHASGQSPASIDSNNVITWGVWYHLAMTRDSAGNFKAYVNGVQQGVTQYYPYNLSGVNRKFWVGRYSNSFFNGLIDEVRVYSRALSQAEISDIYSRNAFIKDGLVLYLPMTEYEGSILYDRSGYGNNGNIYGAEWVIKKAGRVLTA